MSEKMIDTYKKFVDLASQNISTKMSSEPLPHWTNKIGHDVLERMINEYTGSALFHGDDFHSSIAGEELAKRQMSLKSKYCEKVDGIHSFTEAETLFREFLGEMDKLST